MAPLTPSGQLGVTVNLGEVHDVSVDLLKLVRDQDLTVGMASMGMIMTLGRLMAPKAPLSDEEEIKFLTDCLEWVGAYFAPGGAN